MEKKVFSNIKNFGKVGYPQIRFNVIEQHKVGYHIFIKQDEKKTHGIKANFVHFLPADLLKRGSQFQAFPEVW